ncbi:MAG: DNA polymerase III subunit alpha [Myxococcota bacterium]|nr:DNA polymerase III subunit alpha [Myxococcota bacterium]
MSDFVHLHVHSQYSLLLGALKVKDLVTRTAEMKMNALALTDDGNMFGAVDFYKKTGKAGIKPILGVQVSVKGAERLDARTHAPKLVLLAENNEGYGHLRELVSMSYLEGLEHGRPHITMEMLHGRSAGLIGLSGCSQGHVGQTLIKAGHDAAAQLISSYQEVFGKDGFFLEVMPTGIDDQQTVNQAFLDFSQTLKAPLVAANRCMYMERTDARAHEVLMCIGAGRTLDDPYRPRYDVDSFWFKPGAVIAEQLGPDYADAISNTARIAERCHVEMDLGSVYLPQYEVPEGSTIDSYLVDRSREGLEARFKEFAAVDKTVDQAAYHARLTEELEIIKSMGFPGYFLIVMDFINWAQKATIPVGPGRGSGAGSLVAYALRITDLDPIPYGLLFERFLNPERVSMPDFDIDFCMNRRGEVIDYVTQKYGAMNVGQIATFGSLKARGVIKDVGRVLGFTFGERDRLSKMVPEVLGITLDAAMEQEPRLRQMYTDDDRIRDLIDIARKLEGLYKSTGMHAAGVVIGDQALWNYCPVFVGAGQELVTQFAKDEVEEAGLVKFDFLGLKTLTVIDDAVRLVNRGRATDKSLDMQTLGLDDPGVYALISRGDTEGVFQLESSGFQELLKKLKPDKFEDIVAAVALYRPGPLNSGMLDDFIARKHGRQRIEYPHNSLEATLKETYGVIVYQEQVMQIARELAGFTLGAADLLRRAMGKKKFDVMAAQRIKFCAGAKERDIAETTATEIFDLMEKFAEYGFNKSHSAAYALLTYQTAYLKAHHKVEFMAAVLTNDRDNADKVAKGIRNARKIGIEVLAPCANRSGVHFDAVDGKLLFGMGGIKGVGTTSVEAIVEARDEGGPFESLFDFCERVDLKRINKKTMEALINSGAFDFLDSPRARLVAAVDAAIERAQNTQRDRDAGQSSLFAVFDAADTTTSVQDLPAAVMNIHEWPEQELLANEKSALGFYISGHPLDRFKDLLGRYASATIDSLGKRDNHERVTIGGVQTSIRIRPFKNGEGRMAIIQFEDLTGSVEVIAMGQDFDRYETLLTSDEPLLITGSLRIDRDEDRTKLSVRLRGPRKGHKPNAEADVVSLHEIRATKSRGLELEVDGTDLDLAALKRIRAVFESDQFHGNCALVLSVKTDALNGSGIASMRIPIKVKPSDDLNHALRTAVGVPCTIRMR